MTVSPRPTLRSLLKELKKRGELIEIKESLSPHYEVARVLEALEDRPILFPRVEGHPFSLVANLCSRRDLLAYALGTDPSRLHQSILEAINRPQKAIVKPFSSENWEYNEDVDLKRLPILTHYEGEAGPYITASIVAAGEASGQENLSVHRMMILGRDRLVARVVPRHLLSIVEAKGGEADVAIFVGVHPAILLAASLQTAPGLSEYGIANALLKGRLRLMMCEEVEVAVPTEAEVVLEGRISLKQQTEEGPFADLTRTFDDVRLQPIITLKRMHIKRSPLYYALLPGGREHMLLMGLPQELKVLEYVRRAVPGLRGLHFTKGGCSYFHCIMSIRKQTDGDGKAAILNAFAASHSLKLAIVVDDDIDPSDWEMVEWALATRFQADRGLVVIEGARGSTLDPSSEKKGITAKLGIDATLPLDQSREKFRRALTKSSPRVERLLARFLRESHSFVSPTGEPAPQQQRCPSEGQ